MLINHHLFNPVCQIKKCKLKTKLRLIVWVFKNDFSKVTLGNKTGKKTKPIDENKFEQKIGWLIPC